MIGYKLFRLRADGTIGPLFINRRQVLSIGQWYPAEAHLTKGYAYRPGWHILSRPHAPHLSKRGRVWARVEFRNGKPFKRPESQGGLWYLAEQMMVKEILWQ